MAAGTKPTHLRVFIPEEVGEIKPIEAELEIVSAKMDELIAQIKDINSGHTRFATPKLTKIEIKSIFRDIRYLSRG